MFGKRNCDKTGYTVIYKCKLILFLNSAVFASLDMVPLHQSCICNLNFLRFHLYQTFSCCWVTSPHLGSAVRGAAEAIHRVAIGICFTEKTDGVLTDTSKHVACLMFVAGSFLLVKNAVVSFLVLI